MFLLALTATATPVLPTAGFTDGDCSANLATISSVFLNLANASPERPFTYLSRISWDIFSISWVVFSLICSNNFITSVNNLPSSLKKLNCAVNCIDSLDYLPMGLEYLYCVDNNITNLNNLPATLIILDCSDNKITK